MFFAVCVLVYLVATLGLSLYGFNNYYLLTRYYKSRRQAKQENDALRAQAPAVADLPESALPKVLSQIPLYNEVNVAERCIRAVAAMRYPKSRHTIQVVDDSNDETCAIVDRVCEELRAQGYRIEAIRRDHRTGFKAGALKEGMLLDDSEYIAIFDGDFVPPENFLEETVPLLMADSKAGLAQARWGHLNRGESALTLAQAVGIDNHFVVEQTARCFNDLYMNFNGTAGLWRRQAINDGGGWRADTLTEDLDLSYRVQMAGWRLRFLPDLVVPAEIPASILGFKSQQFRWAKGSIQTARILLPKVWKRAMPLRQKVQCSFHLTQYMIHPLIFLVALVALPMAAMLDLRQLVHWTVMAAGALFIGAAAFAPTAVLIASQTYLGRPVGRAVLSVPILMAIGMGIAVSNTKAVLEGILGVNSAFVRTPKAGDAPVKRYKVGAKLLPVFEIALGLYSLAALYYCFLTQNYPTVGFILLYTVGFLGVGLTSLVASVDLLGFARCVRDTLLGRRCEPVEQPVPASEVSTERTPSPQEVSAR
ncbi:MAG: glycosyltransferase [Opitutales bacterium]